MVPPHLCNAKCRMIFTTCRIGFFCHCFRVVVRKMVPTISFVLAAVLVIYVHAASGKTLDDDLSKFMSNMKAELVRNMLKQRLSKKDVTKVTLSHEKDYEMNLTSSAAFGGSLFRRSKENYVFNGSQVLHVHKKNGRDINPEKYSLDVALELAIEEEFMFIKQADWQSIFFLAVCFPKGYCQIVMSHSVTGVTIQQRIGTHGTAFDVEFFVDNEELYLIIASDPCTIYRWTGAYFDVHEELETSGARAVAIFRDKDFVVIVVAQGMTSKKVYSKIYVRKNRKTELIQLLQTTEAIDVVPYELHNGEETLKFILVLDNVESKIFWWTGKEFSLWNTLDTVSGPSRIYVDTIQAELFIFIINQNKLSVYHPTEITFDLVHVFVLDRDILSFDLREEADNSKAILLLTRSKFEPFLTLNFISVVVNYIPVSENQIVDADPVLQCLLELKKNLNDRDKKIDESISLSEEIEKKSGMIELENLDIPQLELKSFRIKQLKVNPSGKELEATPKEIKKEMQELKKKSEALLTRVRSAPVRYRIHGDVVIDKLRAPRIHVRKFNDRAFDLGNILSVTKNQTLSGIIRVNTLSVGTLNLPSIGGVHIRDMLIRNKLMQEIMGEHTIRSMKAKNVVLGKLGKLNGSVFAKSNRTEDKIIHGKKIFSRMRVNQLQVDHINNVTAEEWLSKVLPDREAFGRELVLNFTDLKVRNLTVARINGLPWRTYLESSTGQTGDLARVTNTKARRLITQRINGLDTGSLMTMDTPQNVSSTMEIASANFECIKPKHFKIGPGCSGTSELESGSFDQVKLSEIVFKNPVNISGRIYDLDKLDETYWMKSKAQVIPVTPTFTEEITANKTGFILINNHSISDFVRLDQTGDVTSRIVFEDAEVIGNVTVSPSAHNKINPGDLYNSAVKTKGENWITGTKMFLGKITADRLSFDYLNGANLSADADISKDMDKLEELEITGDLTVKSEINIKNLNNPENPSAKKLDSVEDIPNTEAGKDFRKNVNLKIIVNGDLQAPEIRSRMVNGILFDDYMSKVVLKNGTEDKIKGRKTFLGKVTVRGNLDGIVNGHDLKHLKSVALSKTEAQNITGPVIVHELNANDVESTTLSGVSTDNLLFQDQSTMQTINSDIVFSNIGIAGNLKTSSSDLCDLSKIAEVNLRKVKKINKLDVKGNVTWVQDREDYKGISYIYKNAVRKHHEQIITGSVTFSANATFGKLNTKKHINNVDLGFIVNDALYRSLPVQEIHQGVTIKGTVTADSVLITNNVLVDYINKIDILDFGQRLVRKSEDEEVTGRKEFSNGFSTFRLKADEINGAKTDNIIFCDSSQSGETIKFPATKFESVKTVENLNVLYVNGRNMGELLEERLSKTTSENISASITLKGSLFVKGQAGISQINDVKISDTIPISHGTHLIQGPVEFNETVSIYKNIQVETINEYNITDVYERSLMKDTDSILQGNVIFSDDIELKGVVNVVHTANGCSVKNMRAMEIPQSMGEADMAYSRKLNSEIDKISNTSNVLVKPVVFMDLEVRSSFKIDILNIEKITLVGNNEFHIYGSKSNEGCGYWSNCSCPLQALLTISPRSLPIEYISPRYYKYYDDYLGMEFLVNTTYRSNCRFRNSKLEEEYSMLSWRMATKNSSVNYSRLNISGSIRDVRFFRIANSVYVVIVFYIHPAEKTAVKLNITVQEIDTEKGAVKNIQQIPAKSAEILDIFWSPKGFVLVTGNGYDSETYTDSVESAIYRFSDSENKFQLLRSVNTHGILSITSVTQDSNSFIFLTQKQSWPFLILKYNHEYDNYYLSQKLDVAQSSVKSNFLSGAAFTTSRPGYEGDIFLGIVQSDESFRLFKYKHIEGFVEELKKEQNNIKILLPFSAGSKQYLLAASSATNSTIYELVQDGFME